MPGCLMTAFQIDQDNLQNDSLDYVKNSILILSDNEKVYHIVDEFDNGFEIEKIYDISAHQIEQDLQDHTKREWTDAFITHKQVTFKEEIFDYEVDFSIYILAPRKEAPAIASRSFYQKAIKEARKRIDNAPSSQGLLESYVMSATNQAKRLCGIKKTKLSANQEESDDDKSDDEVNQEEEWEIRWSGGIQNTLNMINICKMKNEDNYMF